MADFIQNSNVKTAVRTLANPIADIAAFNLIVQSVITDNPFACVAYMTGGESHPAVEKTRESYTVKIVYEDSNAKNIGNDSAKYNTIAGFTAGTTALLGSAANIAAHGGTAVRDGENETFAATLRCQRRFPVSPGETDNSPILSYPVWKAAGTRILRSLFLMGRAKKRKIYRPARSTMTSATAFASLKGKSVALSSFSCLPNSHLATSMLPGSKVF